MRVGANIYKFIPYRCMLLLLDLPLIDALGCVLHVGEDAPHLDNSGVAPLIDDVLGQVFVLDLILEHVER